MSLEPLLLRYLSKSKFARDLLIYNLCLNDTLTFEQASSLANVTRQEIGNMARQLKAEGFVDIFCDVQDKRSWIIHLRVNGNGTKTNGW